MSMSLEQRGKWSEEYDTEKFEKYSEKRCQYIIWDKYIMEMDF